MKKVRKILLSIFLLTGLFAVIGQNVNANYGSFKNVTVSETQLTTLATEYKLKKQILGKLPLLILKQKVESLFAFMYIIAIQII